VIVSLIVATDRQGGIGIEGRLPWHLPADLKRFRELTMGHHLIVGRKTFDSIGKALQGRQMIIVTRDRSFHAKDSLVAHSVEEALELARARGEDELFVGGGGEIYTQCLAFAYRIYLTIVEADVKADAFFPTLAAGDWIERESESHPVDGKNALPFTFKLLERR
jgi:dihydrofolate reductase